MMAEDRLENFDLHPSIDTAELRSIAPDWQSRVENYNVLMSDDLKQFLENEEVKLIGYRALRATMRK
jgi:hypothetical protein